jgi:YHS domain-containing protein
MYTGTKPVDPVCGVEVDITPGLTTEYKGKRYYFCSEADQTRFLKDPERYVKEEYCDCGPKSGF